MEHTDKFDELNFFAEIKKRPNMFLGKPSLLSLRDYIFGMYHAFYVCKTDNQFKYFNSFKDWYCNNQADKNGYVSWWNHILYINGNNDTDAFQSFFRIFEQYLQDVHNVSLPEV